MEKERKPLPVEAVAAARAGVDPEGGAHASQEGDVAVAAEKEVRFGAEQARRIRGRPLRTTSDMDHRKRASCHACGHRQRFEAEISSVDVAADHMERCDASQGLQHLR